MTRILKKFICLALGVTAAYNASGFSMWGPIESWQTQDLDYVERYLPCLPLPNLTVLEVQGPGAYNNFNVELGGTKNMGEGSRLNTPIITYAYDTTFLTYFGAQGVAAIDSAFTLLNGLPKASSAKLTEFITEGNQQVNYSAQAMRMLDLKSTVMWLMMEHMGLIGETHTYDLRERVTEPGGVACAFDYVVLQRNFDPVTYSPSQYVNGRLLTYQIADLCTSGVQVGDASEQAAQVGSPPLSCVATREALEVGGYYLRITRDDMGGLRYLYRHDRYVNEGFDTNTTIGTSGGTWNPISLTATNVGGVFSALVGGVEKITFVKTPYDSLLGTGFTPITNHYTIPWVTNGVLRSLSVTRTVTVPDIIFTAGDLTFPGPDNYQQTLARISPTGTPAGFITYGEAPMPGAVNTTATEVTPAVITPELVVTLNNSGQVYYNEGTKFVTQGSIVDLGFIWGSFNGSTNAPIPFPTGTSIEEIEAQVLSAGPETEIGIYNPLASSTNATTAGTSGATP
jgi:hypothetical protein